MIKITHLRIFTLFILGFSNSCSWSQLTMTIENLQGEWVYTTSHSAKILDIKPEGSYTYLDIGGKDMYFSKITMGGNWKIKNDVLILRQTRKKVGWGGAERKTNIIFLRLILTNCEKRKGLCLVKKIQGKEEVIYWRGI